MAINSTITSPILKSIVNGNQKSVAQEIPQQKSQNLQQDTFIKNKTPKGKTEIIAATINAAGKIGTVALFLIGFPKMVSKMKNLDNINKKGTEVFWEDINSAVKLSDMKLDNNTQNTFNAIIENIKNPLAYNEKGGEIINSILLYGPAGTGKTTLAKALAKEFKNSIFANLDVTRLSSSYVGGTERNVQAAIDEICKTASEHKDKKIFVFIDEIDSIMLEDYGSSQKYSNDVINEFKRCLTEKLQKHDNIITIGATNVPINSEIGIISTGKRLDTQMLSRFQQKILIDLPTEGQIKDLFISHYGNKKKVCDELKNADSKKLDTICKFLANKERNTSFRTLKAIFNQAATITDKNTPTSIEDIFTTISHKQKELRISDIELKNLKENLNIQ